MFNVVLVNVGSRPDDKGLSTNDKNFFSTNDSLKMNAQVIPTFVFFSSKQ